MRFETEFETDTYSWDYCRSYGVGCFTRKSDGAETFLETGSDCQQLRRDFRRHWQRCKDVQKRDAIFNSIAAEYTFHTEAEALELAEQRHNSQ